MRIISSKEITNNIKLMAIDVASNLPKDVLCLLQKAYEQETSKLGRYSISQLLENAKIAEEESLPICQDTGICIVFAEVGKEVYIEGALLDEAINEGIAEGYKEGFLRKSVVADPIFNRRNTMNNTPAVVYTKIVSGDKVKLTLLPKGAGSENMSMIKMLTPADGIVGIKSFVIETIINAGANPCPPVMIGVGIGGTMDYAAYLSKYALMRIAGEPNANAELANLENELLLQINATGIGPQGFGGKITAFCVHIEAYPTHMACLPVAVSINCHAARHKEVVI